MNFYGCQKPNRAQITVHTMLGQQLNIISDQLHFKPKTSEINDYNITKQIESLFESEGFEIRNEISCATVVVTISQELITNIKKFDRKVLDQTYSYQWIEDPDTGDLRAKPLISDTYKTVTDYNPVEYYLIKLNFERDNTNITEAEILVEMEEFDQKPNSFLYKIFSCIKSGENLTRKQVIWYDEKDNKDRSNN